MYHTPAQQTEVQGPNQQPVGYPQGHGPPAQPIMYQLPPGQPQPVFTGQPVMGQQGQPMQYFVPAGQPVQPAPGQGAPHAQPPLNQDDEDVTTLRLNTAYIKSGLGCSRVIEFCVLLIAWSCVVVYSNRVLGLDDRANFFRGITIFCWVMVIVFQVIFLSTINKNKNYFRQPSHCTFIVWCFKKQLSLLKLPQSFLILAIADFLQALGIQVVLTILLIACSTSFTIRTMDWYEAHPIAKGTSFNESMGLAFTATIFGLLACLLFLDDIRLLAVMYSQQKAKETAAASVAQQPGTYPQQHVGAVAQ